MRKYSYSATWHWSYSHLSSFTFADTGPDTKWTKGAVGFRARLHEVANTIMPAPLGMHPRSSASSQSLRNILIVACKGNVARREKQEEIAY
jgi:hypothetical protein